MVLFYLIRETFAHYCESVLESFREHSDLVRVLCVDFVEHFFPKINERWDPLVDGEDKY